MEISEILILYLHLIYGCDIGIIFLIRIFAYVKSYWNHETFNSIYCNMSKHNHGIMHKHI